MSGEKCFPQQYFSLVICYANRISNYLAPKSLRGLCVTENRKVIKLMPIGKYESQKSNQLELKASDFV